MSTSVTDAEVQTPAPKRVEKPDTRTRPKPQPPHAVVLHNDPFNGMDFVVRSLCKVFHYGSGRATWLMLRAHVTGRSIVWTGTLELAELKAEQLRGCGADPLKWRANPLKVTIDALPG